MISEKMLFSYYLTLNMKVLRSSETSVNIYQYIRRRIPEEINLNQLFLLLDRPIGPGPPHCRGFTITLRHTTLGRTPLDD